MLCEIAFMALEHGATGLLIRLHHRSIILWIELSGQGCGAHEIAEHDGELATFCWGLGARGEELGRT